jgi:hypothetical protein
LEVSGLQAGDDSPVQELEQRIRSTLASTYGESIVSVEHVLPQTPDAASQWLKDFPDGAKREGWSREATSRL